MEGGDKMPDAKCPKCVSFAKCEHKEVNSGNRGYLFRLVCGDCEHFEEKNKAFDTNGECQCPFCGQIEAVACP